ncbi:hypothetical protein PHSY_001523 [Pseudozyma hubeiensis SY62]|uniref:Uncharacterized protein n=1 Tax=Pseudozyma hubeiensis (strain SY62) TaxID=1305764 RepID=R9NYY7_PSEHS|nr:hypothetical protein PHSY_001523 [Pseudozyma hubeiensis SY62]GAC93954.1 hypothetical protein PHSY_001523 [Pseudozyma hubeiensis SY62]
MVRPSPSPDPLPILGQDAELSLAATEFEVMARGTRHDANLSSSRSSMLLAKRFGEGAKYQFDVDWLDECDCCKQHNKRCYTSAGSLLRSTSCYNCYIRHWTCTVSNIRVNRKSTPAPRKRKSDVTTGKQTASTIELSSDSRFPAFTKQEHSTPITASTSTSQRRTSERAVRPPPHTPVLVTPLPQQPKPTRKRRKRGGPKKPAAEQARTTRYQSELSSPPHSDQEHLSNASASNNGLISQADSEGSCSVAGILCSSAEQAQEPDAEEGGDGIEENAIESSSVAEAHTSTLIHLTRARVNTLLLINDIAVAIQRCQRRLTQAPDNAGLLVIESAVDELVIELTRVVNPNHAAIVDRETTTWTLAQPLDYLRRILVKCQYARGTENLDERGARQVAALVTCETLFDRCMSVISSMKVERSLVGPMLLGLSSYAGSSKSSRKL